MAGKNSGMTAVTKAVPQSNSGGGDIPVWIKVIAIFAYVSAGFDVLAALGAFLGGSFLDSILASSQALGTLGSGLFIILGIVLLGFAAFYFFVGRGLWKGQKWARITMMVLSGLGLLSGIASLFNNLVVGIITIIVSGAILGYLIFGKGVNEAFA